AGFPAALRLDPPARAGGAYSLHFAPARACPAATGRTQATGATAGGTSGTAANDADQRTGRGIQPRGTDRGTTHQPADRAADRSDRAAGTGRSQPGLPGR